MAGQQGTDRYQGRVKWYDERKGYGFIRPDEAGPTGGRDVFVHASDIGDVELGDEDRVEYSLEPSKKGKKAVQVTVIE